MPRGVPKAGFRVRGPNKSTLAKIQNAAYAVSAEPSNVVSFNGPSHYVVEETVEQIKAKLATRFNVLAEMTEAAIRGDVRSLIVSGPPGLGKSYTVEMALKGLDPKEYSIIKGYVKPTGLFQLLWKHRHPSHVIVFDDADSVFNDDIGLNLLKTVTDTTETRTVSWLTQAEFMDDEGDAIPSTFDFEGSIIFISNLDFDAQIEKGHRAAPHMAAMISRSYYIDLMMKTRKDYLVRINSVVEEGKMLSDLTKDQKVEVLAYIDENKNRLRELSLRVAIKLGKLIKHSKTWRDTANVTLLKPL